MDVLSTQSYRQLRYDPLTVIFQQLCHFASTSLSD
jgi:hypothetical protein